MRRLIVPILIIFFALTVLSPASAAPTVTQYIGTAGNAAVDPAFAAATSSQDKKFIDFDGDGFDDVLIGANESSAASSAGTADAGVSIDGAAYLVFGVSAPQADVNLLGLPAARGLTLRGQAPGNAHLGFSVSAAGDVNGDLHPDVIIGAPQHDGSTGRAYVLLGHP